MMVFDATAYADVNADADADADAEYGADCDVDADYDTDADAIFSIPPTSITNYVGPTLFFIGKSALLHSKMR